MRYSIPRKSRRVPLRTPVHLKLEELADSVSKETLNVSLGGMAVALDPPAAVGSLVAFEFGIGDALIEGTGEVVWARPEDGPERPVAVGVRFRYLSPGSRERIFRLVQWYAHQDGNVTPEAVAAAASGLGSPPVGARAEGPEAAEARSPAAADGPPDVPAAEPVAGAPADTGEPPAGETREEPAAPSLVEQPALPLEEVAVGRGAGGEGEAARAGANAAGGAAGPQPAGPESAAREPSAEAPSGEEGTGAALGAGGPRWGPWPEPPSDEGDEATGLPSGPSEPAISPAELAARSPGPRPRASDYIDFAPRSAPAQVAGYGRRRSGPGALLRLLLVILILGALGVAAYLYGGQVLDWVGLGGDGAPAPAPQPAQDAGAPPDSASGGEALGGEEPAGVVSDTVSVGAPDPGSAAEEQAAPPPAPGPRRSPGEGSQPPPQTAPEPQAAAPSRPVPAEPAPPRRAARRIETIRWQESGGGTTVVVEADGTLGSERFTSVRIGGSEPRVLVRIRGIEAPYETSRLDVSTGELASIRTGYHVRPGGNELHIVLDLTSPAVELAGVESRGRELRLRLEGR